MIEYVFVSFIVIVSVLILMIFNYGSRSPPSSSSSGGGGGGGGGSGGGGGGVTPSITNIFDKFGIYDVPVDNSFISVSQLLGTGTETPPTSIGTAVNVDTNYLNTPFDVNSALGHVPEIGTKYILAPTSVFIHEPSAGMFYVVISKEGFLTVVTETMPGVYPDIIVNSYTPINTNNPAGRLAGTLDSTPMPIVNPTYTNTSIEIAPIGAPVHYSHVYSFDINAITLNANQSIALIFPQ